MTYIGYTSLSPVQRLEFNKTGECPLEFVLTQDQGAVVEVLYHTSGTGYYDQGGNVTTEEFDPSDLLHGYSKSFDYTDFRGNQFVKEDHPCHGKRILQLGTKDN